MKIAILSDIHGNLVALEAVLNDIRQQGRFDHIIVGGDFFAPGAATSAILDRLQSLAKAKFLRGNADRYLLDKSYLDVYTNDGWQGELQRAFHWTENRLTRREYVFLASLPFSQTIQLDSNHILLAVHGSLLSDEEGITTDNLTEKFSRMPVGANVVAVTCGHTHVPLDRIINGVRVVNSGSAGLPFDGDPRACYVIMSIPSVNLQASNIQVQIRRVSYDIDKAIKHLYETAHPAAAMNAYNLRMGRPMGNPAIYEANRDLSEALGKG